MAKKNTKNAEVAVVEETKKVAKKTAEKKPVEKSTKKTSAKTAEKKTSEKKPIEKAVKIAKKTKVTEKTVVDEKTTKKAEKKPAVEKVSKRDKMFPKTLDIEGENIIRSDVNSWDAFKKLFDEASEAGKSVYIAVYWPKKFKKEYALGDDKIKFPKDGFPNDLDISEVQFFKQTIERCVAISLYTEAMLAVNDDDMIRSDEDGIIYLTTAESEVYVTK